MFDVFFKEKFGWKARSEGIFCASDIMVSNDYGIVSIFFPIGKYSYLWSPNMIDLYAKFADDVRELRNIEKGYFDVNLYKDTSIYKKYEKKYTEKWKEIYGEPKNPEKEKKEGVWVYGNESFYSWDKVLDWKKEENIEDWKINLKWIPSVELKDYLYDNFESDEYAQELKNFVFQDKKMLFWMMFMV